MDREFLINLLELGHINKLQMVLKDYTLSLVEVMEYPDGEIKMKEEYIPKGFKDKPKLEDFISRFESKNFETYIIDETQKNIFIQLYHII